MVIKIATDQLPSLPQVLVQILDAIQSDKADYQRISDIIRQDTAIASRLIAVANSSYFGRPKQCDTIERALLFLGTDAVKTIVITASIKQFFSHFNQQHNQFLKRFWHRSLVSANLAQVLATLTSYHSPDEAYLCGLLLDVGQLMLLTTREKEYLTLLKQAENDQQLLEAEQKAFNNTHCQLSGDLADSWNIPGFMADALRYHHEPIDLIQDAQHLVKIINLASLLSAENSAENELSDQTLAAADALFGLNESLTTELCNRISDDVDNMANSLGIDINDSEQAQQLNSTAHFKLGERLSELGELAQLNTEIWQARTKDALHEAIQRSLFLTFGINKSLLFLLDQDKKTLSAQCDEQENSSDFKVAVMPGRSLVSDALLASEVKTSLEQEQSLTVIDRQINSFCQSDILVCWPLTTSDTQDAIGTLVFSVTQEQLDQLNSKKELANSLCREIADTIVRSGSQINTFNYLNEPAEIYQNKIREAVHEASNPLSIIRNYLEMLRIKLGDEHSANKSLNLIKEEIERVGNILLRLKDPQLSEGKPGPINVNNITQSIAQIFKDSVCTTKQLTMSLNLDNKMPEIEGSPEHLKQILTNLIKNAVEALSPGDTISITSDSSISFSGKDFVAISIQDNGPGIPDEIKQHLFSPVTSTKGSGHSGLGLSIVKKLIDEMEGSIVCRSNATTGTEFQILLPK